MWTISSLLRPLESLVAVDAHALCVFYRVHVGATLRHLLQLRIVKLGEQPPVDLFTVASESKGEYLVIYPIRSQLILIWMN